MQEPICRNEEKLKATTPDEQQELFEEYTGCVRKSQTIEICNNVFAFSLVKLNLLALVCHLTFANVDKWQNNSILIL